MFSNFATHKETKLDVLSRFARINICGKKQIHAMLGQYKKRAPNIQKEIICSKNSHGRVVRNHCASPKTIPYFYFKHKNTFHLP